MCVYTMYRIHTPCYVHTYLASVLFYNTQKRINGKNKKWTGMGGTAKLKNNGLNAWLEMKSDYWKILRV